MKLFDGLSDRVLLLDGGMGSTIEDCGVDVRNDLWGAYCFVSAAGRDVNRQVHARFVAAGADILTANTHNVTLEACRSFLANNEPVLDRIPPEITSRSGEERVAAFQDWLLEQAIADARAASPTGRPVRVAGCVGSVEPEGAYATESDLTPEEAARRLAPVVQAHRRLGVDLFIFETLTTREEIQGVARLSEEMELGGFAVGLTCGEDGRTLGGVSMAESVAILRDAGPAIHFVQCTPFQLAMAALEPLVDALASDEITGVYANDGRVWKDRHWHGERRSPAAYSAEARRWRDAGARVIGGCCGTGPEHIEALRAALLA